MLRKLWNISVCVSLAILVVVALLYGLSEVRGAALHILWRGEQWELATRYGQVYLDNQPQITEAQDARNQFERDVEAREAPVRKALEKLPWRSPPYLQALAKLRELQSRADVDRSRLQSTWPPLPSLVLHSFSLDPILWVASLLPFLWLTVAITQWIRGSLPLHPVFRSRRRTLYLAATVVSLPICIGITALWMRSRYAIDYLYLNQPEYLLEFSDYRGEAQLHFDSPGYPRSPVGGTRITGWFLRSHRIRPPYIPGYFPVVPSPNGWGFGLYWRTFNVQGVGSGRTRVRHLLLIYLPFWAVFLASILLPFLWLTEFARRCYFARTNPVRDRCRWCGYDLRASRERCPECGKLNGQNHLTVRA
ncbi:MAG TPA: hypothetical protein VFW23_18490 [Tepidisphaeraceae bacterium]|nr:hypothetical protein [Tepidisphaeraceae bacterium]